MLDFWLKRLICEKKNGNSTPLPPNKKSFVQIASVIQVFKKYIGNIRYWLQGRRSRMHGLEGLLTVE